MGSKRRSSESAEVEDGQLKVPANNVVSSNKLKKKIKTEKSKEEESVVDEEAGPSVVSDSIKPMERRKKRKALDKERRRSALENDESKPQKMDVEPKHDGIQASTTASTVGSLSSSILPEFHIGVFKDLVSFDASVREAAAEAVVTELQEVQKACDRLENKDSIEGGLKLDAEKDDGLNECAPSLRYAFRRLIRGVTSSRECARQGFALGLTLLVATIPSIKVDSLLKLSRFARYNFINEGPGSKGMSVGSLICLWCSCPVWKTR